MTRREYARRAHLAKSLISLGFDENDVSMLRRISITLNRWYEGECGDDHSCIERDEVTGKPFRTYTYTHGKVIRTPIRDYEKGALNRLVVIMAAHPALQYYVQSDARSCALYILRAGDIPDGKSMDDCYPSGIAVY